MNTCQGGISCWASRRALPGASPDGGLQPAFGSPAYWNTLQSIEHIHILYNIETYIHELQSIEKIHKLDNIEKIHKLDTIEKYIY